jgi:hypothetical protein
MSGLNPINIHKGPAYPPLEGEGRRAMSEPGWGVRASRSITPSRPAVPADLPPQGGGDIWPIYRSLTPDHWGAVSCPNFVRIAP